jgi:hypothetical protein
MGKEGESAHLGHLVAVEVPGNRHPYRDHIVQVAFDESARIRFQPIMPCTIVPLQISIRKSSTEPEGHQVSLRLIKNLIPAERPEVEKGCPSRKRFGDVADKGRGP